MDTSTFMFVLAMLVLISYLLQPLIKRRSRNGPAVELQVVFAHLIMWIPLGYMCAMTSAFAGNPWSEFAWQRFLPILIVIYCVIMIRRKLIAARDKWRLRREAGYIAHA